MKNIKATFCFKKKMLKLYNNPIFLIFQSFLSFKELQKLFGDHSTNFHIFQLNNF